MSFLNRILDHFFSFCCSGSSKIVNLLMVLLEQRQHNLAIKRLDKLKLSKMSKVNFKLHFNPWYPKSVIIYHFSKGPKSQLLVQELRPASSQASLLQSFNLTLSSDFSVGVFGPIPFSIKVFLHN